MSRWLHVQGKPRDEPDVHSMESVTLRKALEERIWGGPCAYEPRWLDRTDVDYLSGLADAGLDEAGEMIELIREFGAVKVWIE